MTPDFNHPGFRAPRKKRRDLFECVVILLAFAGIIYTLSVFHFDVLPVIAPEAEAAEVPGISNEEAHRIVEAYEGETRVLCQQILGEI